MIVIELVDVVNAVIAVLIVTPASVPVHAGVCPLSQMALCTPPAVNVIVPLFPIAVVVVAFRTICEGVRLIDVSSTSPSIDVIAVRGGGTHVNVAASHVASMQSDAWTGQTVCAFSPLAMQQQRRSQPPGSELHVTS